MNACERGDAVGRLNARLRLAFFQNSYSLGFRRGNEIQRAQSSVVPRWRARFGGKTVDSNFLWDEFTYRSLFGPRNM